MNGLLIAILAYMLLQLAVGYWVSRRVGSESDFLLAGRSLGVGLASFSIFATWFGAESVMGTSAAVAEHGLAGSRVDPFGYSICLVLMALFLAGQLRRFGFVTVGDFFRKRYGFHAEWVAMVIFIPGSIFWAAAQLMAFAIILSKAGGIGFSLALTFAAALVIVYTFLGGLLGDVVTDLMQGIVLIVGLVALLAILVGKMGGVEAAFATIEPGQLKLALPGEGMLERFDTWLVPVLGSMVTQEALSRVFACRDAAVARRAAWSASGIYLLVGFIPLSLGLLGTHWDMALSHRDAFIPTLAAEILPSWLFVIFIGALVSAILSTVDSTLLGASALLAHNLLPAVTGPLPERKKLMAARVGVVVAGVAAYLLALEGENIFSLVEMASSLGTAGILVLMLGGLWSRWGGQRTAIITLCAGAVISIIGNYIFPFEAPFLASLLACIFLFFVCSGWEKVCGNK